MPNYLTLGAYDGVHRGHQKVIRALAEKSRKTCSDSVVAYFSVPPKFVFSGETVNCLITLPEEREALIKRLGVDRVRRLSFTPRLAAMSAEEFFDKIISGTYRAAGLIVGEDFAFGKNRKGHVDFLRRRCASAGIHFRAVPFASVAGHKISSSLIRTCLRSGEVEKANKYLGWNYSVSGRVVRGAGIGRQLGFPTANLAVEPAKILPPGVFAARVRLGRKIFNALVNVGRRPTVKSLKSGLLAEAHILDFDRIIYGRRLEAEFMKHLRPEKKFGSRESLSRQIVKDIAGARRYFSGL